MIQVLQSSDNALLGYISNDFFSSAQSRYQDITNAAIFDFTLPGGSTTGDDIELTPEVYYGSLFADTNGLIVCLLLNRHIEPGQRTRKHFPVLWFDSRP